MKESVNAASGLPDAVQDIASAITSALRRREGRLDVWDAPARGGDDPLTVAAVRVLGADALAPTMLCGQPPVVVEPASVARACAAYPPGNGATPVTVWSHWGLEEALRRTSPADGSSTAAALTQPDVAWVAAQPWQQLTHYLAQLAALALPGADSALHAAVRHRPVDLARGFVRAIRRRDWLQAAGAGRWLAVTPHVPASVGLEAGLEFVEHLSGDDARVALHVRAAQLIVETTACTSVV